MGCLDRRARGLRGRHPRREPGHHGGHELPARVPDGPRPNAGWTGPRRWELVDQLEAGGKLDALGFTTYPYLEFDALADVPAAQWSEIAAHWSGPVLFTELAWPAAPHAPYPGDELEQADFVSSFLDGVAELEVEYATWLFLHDWDQEAASPVIAATGLRDNLASVLRPADLIWRAEVALRQRP